MHEIAGAIIPGNEWEVSGTSENERGWHRVKSQSVVERYYDKHFNPHIPSLNLRI